MFSSESHGLRILFVVSDLHTYTHTLYLFSVGTESIEEMVDFLLTKFFFPLSQTGHMPTTNLPPKPSSKVLPATSPRNQDS